MASAAGADLSGSIKKLVEHSEESARDNMEKFKGLKGGLKGGFKGLKGA